MEQNMRGSRKNCQKGSNVENDFFFFWLMGEGGPKHHYERIIIRPPAKHHLLRFAGVLMMALH